MSSESGGVASGPTTSGTSSVASSKSTSPAPPVAPATAPLSPLVVAKTFIKQYYQVLSTAPQLVHRFYRPSVSILSHGVDATSPTEPQLWDRNESCTSRFFEEGKNLHFDFGRGAIDAQESVGGGIFIVVTGHTKNQTSKERAFVHSFFLANGAPAGKKRQFYVHNDILRFLSTENNEEQNVLDHAAAVDAATPAVVDVDKPANDLVATLVTPAASTVNPAEREEEREQITPVPAATHSADANDLADDVKTEEKEAGRVYDVEITAKFVQTTNDSKTTVDAENADSDPAASMDDGPMSLTAASEKGDVVDQKSTLDDNTTSPEPVVNSDNNIEGDKKDNTAVVDNSITSGDGSLPLPEANKKATTSTAGKKNKPRGSRSQRNKNVFSRSASPTDKVMTLPDTTKIDTVKGVTKSEGSTIADSGTAADSSPSPEKKASPPTPIDTPPSKPSSWASLVAGGPPSLSVVASSSDLAASGSNPAMLPIADSGAVEESKDVDDTDGIDAATTASAMTTKAANKNQQPYAKNLTAAPKQMPTFHHLPSHHDNNNNAQRPQLSTTFSAASPPTASLSNSPSSLLAVAPSTTMANNSASSAATLSPTTAPAATQSTRIPGATLFIKNIPDRTKEPEIRSLFEPFAILTRTKILQITLVAQRGFCFVDFDGPEAVSAVLKENLESKSRTTSGQTKGAFMVHGRVLDVDRKVPVDNNKNRGNNYQGPRYRHRSSSPGNGTFKSQQQQGSKTGGHRVRPSGGNRGGTPSGGRSGSNNSSGVR